MPDSDKIVTLKTFVYPSEAYSLMSRLEDEGIECFLDGENTISVMPFYSQAIGGVKLNVKFSDAERALEIIRQDELCFKEENEDLKDHNQKISHSKQGYKIKVEAFCPQCESTKIFRGKFPLYKTILIIVLLITCVIIWLIKIWVYTPFPILLVCTLLIPLSLTNKKRFCANCGHEWVDS